MVKYTILLITLIISEISLAQHAYFGTRGSIHFDKTTYTRARMRQMMNDMQSGQGNRSGGGMMMGMGRDIGDMPESSTQKMILQFDEQYSLLTMDEQNQPDSGNSRRNNIGAGRQGRGMNMRGGNNRGGNTPRPNMRNTEKVLFQDIKTRTSEIQIEIDDKYLLTDSLAQITWRFTDEYREIAGFECRRVNGSTPDSLYLVAYYTDQIPVSAGPALSHGLPGMILGLVIPEMHIHYWATSVEYSNQTVPTKEWKDKKSKTMTLNEFSASFGRYFQRSPTHDSNKRRILEQLIY